MRQHLDSARDLIWGGGGGETTITLFQGVPSYSVTHCFK
jgi:hypothetical protein